MNLYLLICAVLERVMLERWKKAIDNDKISGALLTDLSKAFDCINHELLIAKINGYGFSKVHLAHGMILF